jgi:hypothetical protein
MDFDNYILVDIVSVIFAATMLDMGAKNNKRAALTWCIDKSDTIYNVFPPYLGDY